MFKSVFRTDVTVFTKWKTVNDVKSLLTGYWLKKWQWSQEWTLIQTLKVTTCMEWPTRSLQSRGTWSGSAVDGWNTHGLPCLNHNQGASSSDIVTKDLRLIPMENIKGLSLDEAIECHYLIALDKWIWITNTTFPSSYWELFIVGDLLLGPQGWDTVHVWEGHWVWEQIPLLWDATWELWRRKDNQLQECLISTNCWKKKSLHLWRMPVITCPWGLCCEGEHSWESWSQLWAVHGAGGLEGWRAQREGDPQHSATCQIEGQKQVDVKLGTMGPSQRPFSSRPILSWMVHQGWRIGCLRWAESLTSSFYTILNPVVSQDLLCELLMWPLPPSTRKSAPSMSGSYISYFQPCYFGNFEYSFLLFLTINLKFPITLNKMTLNKWYFLRGYYK